MMSAASARLFPGLLASIVASACYPTTAPCSPKGAVAVSLAGESFLVPTTPGTYVDTDDQNWRTVCDATVTRPATAASIGLAPDTAELPNDLEVFEKAHQIELRPKPSLSRDRYVWNGPAYVDPASGMTRRDGPNFYLLEAPQLGAWSSPVAIQCDSRITDFCELTTSFSDGLEIHLTIEREKLPMESWPAMLLTARAVFESWQT